MRNLAIAVALLSLTSCAERLRDQCVALGGDPTDCAEQATAQAQAAWGSLTMVGLGIAAIGAAASPSTLVVARW